MLLLTVNSLFAAAFFFAARYALRRARIFLRTGWDAVAGQMQHPDSLENVERRRIIAAGGYYLIGGSGWLVIGLIAGGYTLFFSLETITLLFPGT